MVSRVPWGLSSFVSCKRRQDAANAWSNQALSPTISKLANSPKIARIDGQGVRFDQIAGSKCAHQTLILTLIPTRTPKGGVRGLQLFKFENRDVVKRWKVANFTFKTAQRKHQIKKGESFPPYPSLFSTNKKKKKKKKKKTEIAVKGASDFS